MLASLRSTNGVATTLGQVFGRLLPPISIGINLGGLLRAVPKKKTSHSKKRMRQLTGRKQIQPLNNLNRCPACGHYKRAHTLCMRCVSQIQRIWKTRDAAPKQPEQNLHPVDKRILYPGKHISADEQKLKDRDYLYTRPKTLPVEPREKGPKVKRPRE